MTIVRDTTLGVAFRNTVGVLGTELLEFKIELGFKGWMRLGYVEVLIEVFKTEGNAGENPQMYSRLW